MKRFKTFALTASGVAAAVGLSACGGTSTTTPSPQSGAQYNAAIGAVVNPSGHKGGTIRFDNSSVPDSTDPGNTYYAHMWNTVRLYGRTLITYKSVPGTGATRSCRTWPPAWGRSATTA